jgi:hypothetical protein
LALHGLPRRVGETHLQPQRFVTVEASRMTEPATDTEAIVVCDHLAPWRLHGFATNPAKAIRDEGSHGSAGGGWRVDSSRKGLRYEYAGHIGTPVLFAGVVPWPRVTELVQAAVTPELLAELGDAIAAKQAHGFLSTRDTWAWQRNEPPIITDREAHNAEGARLHWLIYDLGEQIKDRIRNPLPLGQLDMLDLLAGAR